MKLQRWVSDDNQEEIHWFSSEDERYIMGMNPQLLTATERKQFLRLVDQVGRRLHQTEVSRQWAFLATSFGACWRRLLRPLGR